jgi:deoxyribonuclease V
MKLVMDVHFDAGGATAAAVAFDDWDAAEPDQAYVTRIATVAPAADAAPAQKPPRGAPDLKALPALLQLLKDHALAPDVIVLSGFVHLDAQETPGLGWHLHDALRQATGRTVPVIGISKKAMAVTPAQFEVVREEETAPLIVTCIGIDLASAKARLRTLHGRRRVPTLLKRAARWAKGNGDD